VCRGEVEVRKGGVVAVAYDCGIRCDYGRCTFFRQKV